MSDSPISSGLLDKRRWLIRRIFLQRHPDYSLTEAAKALGMRPRDFARKVESEEIETEMRVETRVPWESLADAALDKWPLEVIFDALGDDAAHVIPRLLQPVELRAVVPSYLRIALEYEAAQSGRTFTACLSDVLHDAAASIRIERPRIDRDLPGFADALLFPQKPETE